MDEVSRAFYEVKFELAFLKRKADEFQDLFSTVMEKRHPCDFIRVRPWGNVGDRKNDGYLRTRRTLFQCYAPNELKAAECISKIMEDFEGALPFWEEHFDTWIFVHNSDIGLGPDVTKVLLDLDAAHPSIAVRPWGFEELRREAMELAERELAALLGPAPSRPGMIALGLEELVPILDQIARLAPVDEPDLRPVPADKLERNLLSPAVRVLLRAGMSRADLVRKYFRMHGAQQDQVAESFRARYAALRGTESPDNIFAELQRFAAGDRVAEPGKQNAVLAVLAFFFEECDIFERPEASEVSA